MAAAFKDKALREQAPVFSLLIILTSLFIVAFVKMNVRRMGYALHKEREKFDSIQDEYYKNLIEYGRLNQSGPLTKQARKARLQEVQKGQIIQVVDGKVFVIH